MDEEERHEEESEFLSLVNQAIQSGTVAPPRFGLTEERRGLDAKHAIRELERLSGSSSG